MAEYLMSQDRLNDPRVLLAILDNLPTSIFVKDDEARFIYSNNLHSEMIDKPEKDLLGRSDADFYEPEVAEGFLSHDRRVLQDGVVDISEEMASLQSGMSMPVLTRKARLVGPDGKTYLIGTNTDLTEIKRREEQYKALSETVPVGIAQVDDKNGVSFCNPLFKVYSGGDGVEESQNALLEKLGKGHAGFPGEACKFETEFSVIGQPLRSVIVISSGWLTAANGNRYAIISVVDISEMMELRRINAEVSRLNKELAANMKRLKDAQDELVNKGRMEQLGQLTATIAHELRNPLGSVRTSAFLMERKIRGKGLGVEVQLDRINKGVVRCDNIITQLLDFSRTKQLQCVPGDIDAWLSGVVEEEARKLPANLEIEVVLGLDGKLVPFDPGRLQRAIVNMMSNAAEAMMGAGEQLLTRGGEAPKLVVSTYFKEGHVSVRIADNGPGIPPDVMTRIREPLFTTKSFGTGLGVPAIEQIAAQHGGRLDIESDVGKGSKFTLWLPLQTVNFAEGEKAA